MPMQTPPPTNLCILTVSACNDVTIHMKVGVFGEVSLFVGHPDQTGKLFHLALKRSPVGEGAFRPLLLIYCHSVAVEVKFEGTSHLVHTTELHQEVWRVEELMEEPFSNNVYELKRRDQKPNYSK